MRYTQIPGTELKTSVICLGCGSLGSAVNQEDSFALLDAFVAQGGNFLDTAKVYADWLPIERSVSENTIGRWMKARRNRDRVMVGTKGAHPDLATMHIPRMSRQEIAGDVDASLKHLQVDVIDLYWLHRDDPARPAGEIIESLNEHVRAGKIRYLGCSNWRADRIEAAQAYAVAHGLQGFAGDQMLWSLAAVDIQAMGDPTLVVMQDELKRYHAQTGLAAIPYSSQAGGLFNKMAVGAKVANPGINRMYQTPENTNRFERIQRLAHDAGLSITQVVLGYLLAQPFVTVPIVGCRTLDQLNDSLRAADAVLPAEQVRYLEGG
jgi:aryl-alcohol dehydrogenase-like predicted oxidoreductase